MIAMIESGLRRTCLASLVIGAWALRASADPCDLTQVPYCTWAGNSSGFFSLGDTSSLISFQTLPDGTPSFGGAAITPAFNYVLQGASFSPALPSLFISGNTQLGFGLTAHNSNIVAHNSITAQLTNPERGVGVYVLDDTALLAYDADGTLIASVSHNVFNSVRFLGIKSNVPIARAVIDNGHNSVDMDNFTMIHIPVPEPASAALLLLAAPLLLFARIRRARPSTACHPHSLIYSAEATRRKTH